MNFTNTPLYHFPITHYSNVPKFQHSDCERSELTSKIVKVKPLSSVAGLTKKPSSGRNIPNEGFK